MKGLRVKKSSLFIGALFFVQQLYAGSEFCFDKPINIYCQNESELNFSLNGSFKVNGNFYEFSARRAFDGGWCQNNLDKILKVMNSGNYCMTFEENSENFDLTIDEVVSKSAKWTYFIN